MIDTKKESQKFLPSHPPIIKIDQHLWWLGMHNNAFQGINKALIFEVRREVVQYSFFENRSYV